MQRGDIITLSNGQKATIVTADTDKFKNIIKRIPLSRKQIIPYFMFNFFYRKFGWLTEGVAKVVNFERVGRFAEWVSRYMVSKES